MLAWTIFTHSLRQVFGNLNGALKVSAILYLVMMLTEYLMVGDLFLDQQKMQAAMMAGTLPWGKIAVWILITLICGLWIVIGWHRYVLMNEFPRILPSFHGQNMATYFGKTVLLTLIFIPVAIGAAIVATILIGMPMIAMNRGDAPNMAVIAVLGILAALVYLIPVVWIGYRLAPLFPAAALGRPMTLGQAWAATKGQNVTILLLGLISIFGVLILGLPSFLFAGQPILAQAYSFIIGWVQMLVGASIITTIYGHFVEGRSLVA